MALTGIFYPHAIAGTSLNGEAGNDLKLTPFDDVTSDFNYEFIERMGGADPHPCFVGVMSSDPNLTFTTTAIENYMAVVRPSADSMNIVIDASVDEVPAKNQLYFYYAKGKPNAFRYAQTDTQHLVGLMDGAAMLFWTQLRARQDELAQLAVTVATRRWDAATNPLVWTGKQAITEGSVCQPLFVLGPIRFGGRLIESITEMTWDNNINRAGIRTGGDFTPCWQSINNYSPMVTCLTNDLEEAAMNDLDPGAGVDIRDTFGGQTGLLEVYLRRKQATGALVDPGSASHIKLTVSDAVLKVVPNISGVNPAQARLEFRLAADPASFGTPLFTYVNNSTIP